MFRFLALCLLEVTVFSYAESGKVGFLISSPHVYRSGYEETFNIDLFGEQSYCKVELRLYHRRTNNSIASSSGSFSPGQRGQLKLKIPVNRGRYVDLEGTVCGEKTERKSVWITSTADYKTKVLIQTDKPIYKPGQKIRMRIISIDQDLKPSGKKASSVYVEIKETSTRIMQWNDVKLEDGIASLELQLSKEPVLGEWKITAVVEGEKGIETVTVKKYVLPKFEVIIRPPSYMALDQKEFTTSICAKYTYGKNVKGKLNALFCLEDGRYWGGWRRNDRKMNKSCQNITKEIDGCTDILLTREALNVHRIKNHWGARFKINASVTETLTGVTLKNGEVKTGIQRRSIQFDFRSTSNQFKPGLPFLYKLGVIHPDGQPVSGAKVRVTISRGYYPNKPFYNKTFVVTNGLIKDWIHDATYNARSLQIRATLLDKNPYAGKTNDYPVTGYFSVQPWYSPSQSFLQILKPKNQPLKVGSDLALTVRYTVRNDTGKNVEFYYTVLCKGNAVVSDTVNRFHDYVIGGTPSTTMRPTTTSSSNKTLRTTETILARWRRPWWQRATPEPLKELSSTPVVDEFKITVPVTLEMVPFCRVLVYYVRKDKEVVADSMNVKVETKLENEVSINFDDDNQKPGDEAMLTLKAKPGSRVAFVAVDKSIHLLKKGHELTLKAIEPLLHRQDTGRAWNENPKCTRGWYGWRRKRMVIGPWDRSNYEDAASAFNEAGVLFLTNLNINTKPCQRFASFLLEADEGLPGPRMGGNVRARLGNVQRFKYKKNEVGGKKDKAIRERREFPEIWLWAEEKILNGTKTVKVTVPDTITTWVANAFAMSSTAGLGIAKSTSLTVFQPFFVQMTLPYSVIRGEEIPVLVTIFNYMSSCLPVKVQIKHKSDDYKVTSYHIDKMCVCGNDGESRKFTIIPTALGYIDLTVVATTSSTKVCQKIKNVEISTQTAGDAVTRKLLVEPEGVRQDITKGTFFCPKDGEFKEEFNLRLPRFIIPGSVYATATIMGDIMGPALSNLEDLLRMPYGCGERNMANFAPNIYILDYLTKTGQVTEDIKNKAENFMKIGYQRELRYKRKSGSYSAFGDGDKKGSMMLTAFVVRSFARAKKYIFIDDKQVEHSLRWFEKKQNDSTGCFQHYGKLFHKGLQGGVNSELTITAYVTAGLLEAGQSVKSAMVSKALSCIEQKLDSIAEPYPTALVSYTLTLAKHRRAGEMIKKLMKLKGNKAFWSANSKKRGYYYPQSAANVEMTAYALLAMLEHQKDKKSITKEMLDIVRWLSSQRNAYGGFYSTQDTCVALQALAEFAAKAYNGNSGDFKSNSLSVSLDVKSFNHSFNITTKNRMVLQKVELPERFLPGKLKVTANGGGCALLQTSLKYNIPKPEDIPAFDVKVDVRKRRSKPDEENTLCSPLKLDITVKWLKEDVSNMAVVDVKLVTGFSVRIDSLEELRQDPSLTFKRFDIDGQHVMLYFDEIKDMKFSIDIHQDTLVKKLQPAVIKVYDYYEPESQAKVMYSIGDGECYSNKIESECPKCMFLENPDALIKAVVNCSSTVTRMRSKKGMLKVIKAFSKDARKNIKKELRYEIPEICPCEEIYEKTRAVFIGKDSYFREKGGETTIVLNSGTTIFKWTGPHMKKYIQKIKKIIRKCQKPQ